MPVPKACASNHWVTFSYLCLTPLSFGTWKWCTFLNIFLQLEKSNSLGMCHRTSNPVKELLWVSRGHEHDGCELLPPQQEQGAFHPVAEEGQPRPGEKHNSPEDLLPGSFPIYIFSSARSSGLQCLFIPVRQLAAWPMISCALMINGFPI